MELKLCGICDFGDCGAKRKKGSLRCDEHQDIESFTEEDPVCWVRWHTREGDLVRWCMNDSKSGFCDEHRGLGEVLLQAEREE